MICYRLVLLQTLAHSVSNDRILVIIPGLTLNVIFNCRLGHALRMSSVDYLTTHNNMMQVVIHSDIPIRLYIRPTVYKPSA